MSSNASPPRKRVLTGSHHDTPVAGIRALAAGRRYRAGPGDLTA
jgi:hypothetical protein